MPSYPSCFNGCKGHRREELTRLPQRWCGSSAMILLRGRRDSVLLQGDFRVCLTNHVLRFGGRRAGANSGRGRVYRRLWPAGRGCRERTREALRRMDHTGQESSGALCPATAFPCSAVSAAVCLVAGTTVGALVARHQAFGGKLGRGREGCDALSWRCGPAESVCCAREPADLDDHRWSAKTDDYSDPSRRALKLGVLGTGQRTDRDARSAAAGREDRSGPLGGRSGPRYGGWAAFGAGWAWWRRRSRPTSALFRRSGPPEPRPLRCG